jgi:penicillin-binding protein 2
MREENGYPWKYWILKFGLVLSLLILLATVLRLSLIQKDYYSEVARDNKIFESVIPAPRVEIVDRKGRTVAKSVYQYFKLENGNKIYQNSGDFDGYKFEGKDLAYELKRQYSYGESMSMITGYVGKIDDEDMKSGRCGYKLRGDDVIGRSGIEGYLDCEVRGRNGKRVIEIDALGNYVRELGREEPEIKPPITLSIDAYWQDKIYKLLGGRKAVVIISQPKTGKILSLVSSPAYNANDFTDQNNEKISQYLADKNNLPLLNRAITARYHPGSVFKIAVSTAGLESGVINKETLIEDTGVLKVGDYSYKTWSGSSDGMVDVVKAIRRSNDIFFYKLGEMLGVDRIRDWAKNYGYGAKTGVELSGEVEGVVPDEDWKKKVKGESWYLGNTYHLAIGQGDLDVTPIQVNQMTNVIANHGEKCKMSILKDSKVDCKDVGISNSTWQTVIEGMKQACKPGGTAWPLFNFKTQLACKTGTAEVGDGSKDTHAWLTAFAPADNPEISITVMVERGGEGSDIAAPIVGDILKEWFNEPETVVPRYTTNKEEGE